ncbi:hypothetical protein ACTQ3L_04010, partial [Oscillospiraceae bacterium LCP25S3_E4]
RNEKLTRGKSESLIAPQSSILLLLEGLLFTQNFMGCRTKWYNVQNTQKISLLFVSQCHCMSPLNMINWYHEIRWKANATLFQV